jgi:hypothetical protein
MTPYERRLFNLERLALVARIRGLESQFDQCTAVILRIRGRLSSVNKSIDLGFAQRRRLQVRAELAEARAREQTLARQLERPRDPFADIREREETGMASFAALEKMFSGR